MIHKQYFIEREKQEILLGKKNKISTFYNGMFYRYENPVLTREHAPLHWKYDLNEDTNPFFMERLGINAVMNAGAIILNDRYYLIARVEGADRKSFFAVAESENGEALIYYAASDTRVHVAKTSVERLEDYLFHTPKDPLRSADCVIQRCELIRNNLAILKHSEIITP